MRIFKVCLCEFTEFSAAEFIAEEAFFCERTELSVLEFFAPKALCYSVGVVQW
jgi:hypothetical protein